jgi:hypothetical protein
VAVGEVADRAVFSVGERVDPQAAETAWSMAAEVGASIYRPLDLRQRWQARLAVGDAPSRPVARG